MVQNSLAAKNNQGLFTRVCGFGRLHHFHQQLVSSEGKKADKPSGTKGRKEEKHKPYTKRGLKTSDTSSATCEGFVLGGKGLQEKMTSKKSAPVLGFCAR